MPVYCDLTAQSSACNNALSEFYKLRRVANADSYIPPYVIGCPIYLKIHKNMVAQKYVILIGIKMHFLSFQSFPVTFSIPAKLLKNGSKMRFRLKFGLFAN